MGNVMIRADGLGKRYRLDGPRERYTTLRDQIGRWASLARARSGGAEVGRPPFWALKGVSFEVGRGDVVGIIGRNGAGKSTLLKILSRITEPTEGEADIHGRSSSLLEVGTGFHPELSGRENIYLNGAILGMKRAETARKFDEIVAFAEVERFIDTPVKHYSSGMYTRLAFAVAAHMEPEILIVDEVLAVGDAAFQKKCLGKMGDVARGGRTVLFVSHNLHAVNSLCNRGLVLHGGRVVFEGTAQASVAAYLDRARADGPADAGRADARPGSGEWRFAEVVPTKAIYDPGEAKEFRFEVAPTRAGAGAVYLSGLLINEEGTTISQLDSRLTGGWIAGPGGATGRLRVDGPWLRPGRYTVDFYVCQPGGIVDQFERAAEFEVSPVLPYPQTSSPDATASGLVLSDYAWRIDP
ncbi:polysaccharide ABC transporter ATP-binding protein (plasmid) [Tundrisphaera sp. TA3]|uniref:ABC transporter ATP-binding protein n=1 Tax=Tundrisphaera sp. TA3 TaxID=3435775 RepID=UPI003EBA6EE2